MGQPLLIGTSSIQTSEFVGSLLTKANITHAVLNAKFHEQEAQIISRAGQYKSVVVATNMAGRGTDIKLEDALNNKIAQNYATWIENMTSGNNKEKTKYMIKASIYSNKEFELTIDALQKKFAELTEEKLIAAYKGEQQIAEYKIKINLNTKKKTAHEIFADIIISHNETIAGEGLAKNFHY